VYPIREESTTVDQQVRFLFYRERGSVVLGPLTNERPSLADAHFHCKTDSIPGTKGTLFS